MPPARLAGAAIVLGLFGGTTAADDADAQLRCATSGKTVRANDVARVFTTRPPGRRIYYACSRDTGRVHRLIAIRRDSESVQHPRLTGRSFAAEYSHRDLHESFIYVWGVRSGREIWSGVTGDDEFADDVEVTRRGAVAWLGWSGDVRKVDRDGRATIGKGSRLSRRGRTVYWRSGGERQSYALRGRAQRR